MVPRQLKAGWTIDKAMEELLALNGHHEYSYTPDELVALLGAHWPFVAGERI